MKTALGLAMGVVAGGDRGLPAQGNTTTSVPGGPAGGGFTAGKPARRIRGPVVKEGITQPLNKLESISDEAKSTDPRGLRHISSFSNPAFSPENIQSKVLQSGPQVITAIEKNNTGTEYETVKIYTRDLEEHDKDSLTPLTIISGYSESGQLVRPKLYYTYPSDPTNAIALDEPSGNEQYLPNGELLRNHTIIKAEEFPEPDLFLSSINGLLGSEQAKSARNHSYFSLLVHTHDGRCPTGRPPCRPLTWPLQIDLLRQAKELDNGCVLPLELREGGINYHSYNGFAFFKAKEGVPSYQPGLSQVWEDITIGNDLLLKVISGTEEIVAFDGVGTTILYEAIKRRQAIREMLNGIIGGGDVVVLHPINPTLGQEVSLHRADAQYLPSGAIYAKLRPEPYSETFDFFIKKEGGVPDEYIDDFKPMFFMPRESATSDFLEYEGRLESMIQGGHNQMLHHLQHHHHEIAQTTTIAPTTSTTTVTTTEPETTPEGTTTYTTTTTTTTPTTTTTTTPTTTTTTTTTTKTMGTTTTLETTTTTDIGGNKSTSPTTTTTFETSTGKITTTPDDSCTLVANSQDFNADVNNFLRSIGVQSPGFKLGQKSIFTLGDDGCKPYYGEEIEGDKSYLKIDELGVISVSDGQNWTPRRNICELDLLDNLIEQVQFVYNITNPYQLCDTQTIYPGAVDDISDYITNFADVVDLKSNQADYYIVKNDPDHDVPFKALKEAPSEEVPYLTFSTLGILSSEHDDVNDTLKDVNLFNHPTSWSDAIRDAFDTLESKKATTITPGSTTTVTEEQPHDKSSASGAGKWAALAIGAAAVANGFGRHGG